MVNLRTLISAINEGMLDKTFETLYITKDRIAEQKERYVHALGAFEELYGERNVSVFSAPGRSEIGGNHTDHQNGKVLAGAVNLDMLGIASPVDEMVVRICAKEFGVCNEVSLHNLSPAKEEYGTTTGLIRGMAAGLVKRGYAIGGFEVYVTSDVMIGSGLSSSAAFEVLIGTIFSHLYNKGAVDAITLAQIGQESENQFFGKPCGLMDQMACAVGGLTYIDFGDPAEPIVEKMDVELASFGYALCIVDTKGSHADLTEEYAAVPGEMKSVARFFNKSLLCEVKKEEFYGAIPTLRKACGDRAVLRSVHWYAENERVQAQVQALNVQDVAGFLQQVKASGDSSYKYLQNVYTVKDLTKQNLSLALAVSEQVLQDGGACRVHGGGFAGTIQAFVPIWIVANYKFAMEEIFGADACKVLQIRSVGGCKVI